MSGNTIRKWGETNAPCRGCEDRVVGCHSTCPRYKEFKDGVEQLRQQRCEFLKWNDVLTDIHRKRVGRYG